MCLEKPLFLSDNSWSSLRSAPSPKERQYIGAECRFDAVTCKWDEHHTCRRRGEELWETYSLYCGVGTVRIEIRMAVREEDYDGLKYALVARVSLLKVHQLHGELKGGVVIRPTLGGHRIHCRLRVLDGIGVDLQSGWVFLFLR